MKDYKVFEENKYKVYDIKWELMKLKSKLEDAGLTRKANILGTIIENLEHWQHTK